MWAIMSTRALPEKRSSVKASSGWPSRTAWEPAFTQDLEWTLLAALGELGRSGGSSSYFRLSTRPIDQSIASVPTTPLEREQRRRHAVAGGYSLKRGDAAPSVVLVGVGAVMSEVVAASSVLDEIGVGHDVICLTSPDLVFRAMQSRQGLGKGSIHILDVLFPIERRAPLVTVLDGHPHTLSFLAGVNGSRIACLGVDDFGQVGDIDDLYRYYGIDQHTIAGAALDLLDGPFER
jgi:pyruvate dehydrogenase E1 component